MSAAMQRRVGAAVHSAPRQQWQWRSSGRPRLLSLSGARASRNDSSSVQQSFSMLEAFFMGRALAEVLNERLGAALGDALADVGKLEAEIRRAVRDFEDEVVDRAQREMSGATGSSSEALPAAGRKGGRPLPAARAPDIDEAADELRAEVAATRALVQQLKAKKQAPA